MANLSNRAQVFSGDTSIVDATAQQAVFTRAFGPTGYEYIYLLGVGTAAANNLANWNQSTGQTILVVADAVGPVGVAQAAAIASTYSWFQIWGHTSCSSDTVAGIGAVYIDGTAGRFDDADVAGDVILGAFSTAADATNVCPAFVTYPFVTNIAID